MGEAQGVGTAAETYNQANCRHTLGAQITVTHWSMGTVVSGGGGADVTLDAQLGLPYGTLYTGVDVGAGTRATGGLNPTAPRAAAFTTYWNISTSTAATNGLGGRVPLPAANYGPFINLVGFPNTTVLTPQGAWWGSNPGGHAYAHTNARTSPHPPAHPRCAVTYGWWQEPAAVNASGVWPRSLYEAQAASSSGRVTSATPSSSYAGPGYGCNTGIKCCWDGSVNCPVCPAAAQNASKLWGCGGELWDPAASQARMAWDW